MADAADTTARPAVRITGIEAAPLFGESPKGGWTAEIKPEDSIHALIAVHTDADITGFGSVFTDGRLVAAALQVLEPLFRGENPLEPIGIFFLLFCGKNLAGFFIFRAGR